MFYLSAIDIPITFTTLMLDHLMPNQDALMLYIFLVRGVKSGNPNEYEAVAQQWVREEGSEEKAKERFKKALERLTFLGLVDHDPETEVTKVKLGERYDHTDYTIFPVEGNMCLRSREYDSQGGVIMEVYRPISEEEIKDFEKWKERIDSEERRFANSNKNES
jgi:hypothetical protein